MLSGGWRVGRIGGVEVRIDPSLGIIAVLITFNLSAEFSNRFPALLPVTGIALAAVTAVLFFASVLVHELAHAGMSRVRDIPVLGITLWLFGGATHAKIEARGPADEFLVTVVGPLSSAALGALFLLARALGELFGAPLRFMFGYLAFINVLLAVFNLLPGFPLDGGRLLRSGLWKLTGNLGRATRLAARAGQGVALLIIGAGLVRAAQRSALVLALWPALIGWFLFRAASEALTDEVRRRRLRSVVAGDVMSAPPPTVPANLPVGTARQDYLDGHQGEAFPVVENGAVVGFITLETATSVPPDRPVREAMTGMSGTIEARSAEPMDRIVERLERDQGRTVLVVEGDRVVGVIEPGDLARYLRSPSGSGAAEA